MNLKQTLMLSVLSFAFVIPQGWAREYSEVRGEVKFEQRSTIVPMVCEFEQEQVPFCEQSKPYWSVVLYKDEVRYELNRMFAVGSNEPPEEVDVDGVVIRADSRVKLKGWTEAIAEDYHVITELESIEFAMDARQRQ